VASKPRNKVLHFDFVLYGRLVDKDRDGCKSLTNVSHPVVLLQCSDSGSDRFVEGLCRDLYRVLNVLKILDGNCASSKNHKERSNGETRALQERGLFQSQQFATAVYQSELTYRLRQLGYEITTGRSGAPEIKGYTQEYLDASSPRSQQIREYLERTGRSGKEAAEIAAHSTRDRKEIHSLREVMAAHRKLAADFGHQADSVVRAARERSQQHENIFARDKNFEREAVVDERALIRDGLRRGMVISAVNRVRESLTS
jgi:TrwC relaxase